MSEESSKSLVNIVDIRQSGSGQPLSAGVDGTADERIPDLAPRTSQVKVLPEVGSSPDEIGPLFGDQTSIHSLPEAQILQYVLGKLSWQDRQRIDALEWRELIQNFLVGLAKEL